MTSHLGVMVLFAALVSTVFGTLMRDALPDQIRLAGRIFVGLVAGAYITGWLMYLVFGQRMPRVLWLWGPAILQMAIIFVASSLPGESLPSDVPDHTAHFIGYALLGALVLRALAGARWDGVTIRAAGLAWIVSALYGMTDELHQGYVSGRTPTPDDWMADALGAATAVLALVSIARLRRRLGREV